MVRGARGGVAARLDLHIHSCYSVFDGMMSPRAIVKLADQLGYDGIAVTDHYTYDGAIRGTLATARLAEDRGLSAWTGLEYHVTEGEETGHVLLYFDDEGKVPERGLELDDLLDHAHDEDLTVVHPHPFGYAGITAERLFDAADYVELNGSYGEGAVNGRTRDRLRQRGETSRLVANTDAHARGQMGSAFTEVTEVLDDLRDTLATRTGCGLEAPRRSWGRAAKIARTVAQPAGFVMNGIQRLVTRFALRALDDPSPGSPAETPRDPSVVEPV